MDPIVDLRYGKNGKLYYRTSLTTAFSPWKEVPNEVVTVPGTITPSPNPAPHVKVEIRSNDWIENRCDFRQGLSGYLYMDQLVKLEEIAQKIGVRLICTHANPMNGGEGAHTGNAIDLLYFDTKKMVQFVLLMVATFPLCKSTIANPTNKQIISAAVQESDDWNHDVHMHIELTGGRILMHTKFKNAIMGVA